MTGLVHNHLSSDWSLFHLNSDETNPDCKPGVESVCFYTHTHTHAGYNCIPIHDSTTSAFQLNCRKAEFSSSLAFLWAAALSSSATLPRRAFILAVMLSTWWFSCSDSSVSVWWHTHLPGNINYTRIKWQRYLLDEFVSVSTHIAHSVPVHSKVRLKRLVFLQ